MSRLGQGLLLLVTGGLLTAAVAAGLVVGRSGVGEDGFF